MLPRLCSPLPPSVGVELLGAESVQSPTLTSPPAEGAPKSAGLFSIKVLKKK